MKIKRLGFIVAWIAIIHLIILTNACDYEIIRPKKIVEDTTKKVTYGFQDTIIPIFNLKCNISGCHVAGHFKVDLTPANAYNDIFAKGLVDTLNPEQSKLYSKLITPGGSHDGRSTAQEQFLILSWIKQGAKNN